MGLSQDDQTISIIYLGEARMLKKSTRLVILTIFLAAIVAGAAIGQKRSKHPLPAGLQNLAESKAIEVRNRSLATAVSGNLPPCSTFTATRILSDTRWASYTAPTP